MKIIDMVKAFEKEGFTVTKSYIADKRAYCFNICKDGVSAEKEFAWIPTLSNEQNCGRQELFVKYHIREWEKECEKSSFNPFTLQRTIAAHGDKAKLIVGNQVYHMPISEATVNHMYGENPHVEVTGHIMKRDSTVEEFCANNVEPLYPKMPIVLAARGNGKSLQAMRQIYEMISCSNPFAIEKVIFNGPATIVMWMDGTKTIVKCQDGDEFDPEKGLAMAISKKALGNKRDYYHTIRHWTKKQPKTIDLTTPEAIMHMDVDKSYQKLLAVLNNKKSTKAAMAMVMEEVIGYLGHALDT